MTRLQAIATALSDLAVISARLADLTDCIDRFESSAQAAMDDRQPREHAGAAPASLPPGTPGTPDPDDDAAWAAVNTMIYRGTALTGGAPVRLVRPGECEGIEDATKELPVAHEVPAVVSAGSTDSVAHRADVPLWGDRLVFDFKVSITSPVIRGTWVTVSHIVSLLVDGCTWPDILQNYPELTKDDIWAAVAYSVKDDARSDH